MADSTNPVDDKIFAKLSEVVRTFFDEYSGPVEPGLTAKSVSQWDSLANVQFMVLVEQTFEIRFTTQEIAQLRSLGDLARLIAAKRK
jgi:acyl carrier protein